MPQYRPRVAGLLALLASLVLVPGAWAGAPSKAPSAAKGNERAYGQYCGPKRGAPARTATRTKCLDAMSQIASGATTSPKKACRALKRKRAKGERTSAFARCVSGAKRLVKDTDRGSGEADGLGDDDPRDEGDSADDTDGPDDPDDPDDAGLDGADSSSDDDDEALDSADDVTEV